MSKLTASELYYEIERYSGLKFHYPITFEVETRITNKCECCRESHKVEQVSYFDENLIDICPNCGNRIKIDLSNILRIDQEREQRQGGGKLIIKDIIWLVIVFITAYILL